MRLPDRLLLLACGALVLAGPIMGAQEYAKALEARSVEGLTGEAARFDHGYRDVWGLVVFGLVLVAGMLGTLMMWRVSRAPRVRSVSARLLVLLGVGLLLLDLGFLLDRRTADDGFLVRVLTVTWIYPLAAGVVAMSATRLAELEEAFGERAPARGALA